MPDSVPRYDGQVEGIYLLELSNGSIKVGRSVRLADRLRTHDTWIAAAGLYVTQSWTCSVQDSDEVEAQVLATFQRMPGVQLVAGRETFTGLSFFVAITLARDVCFLHAVSIEDYTKAPGPGRPPTPAVLWDMVEIMDEIGGDRIRTRDLLPRLAERDQKYDIEDTVRAAQALALEIRPSGVQGVRWSSGEKGPVRGYMRDDVLAAIRGSSRASRLPLPPRPGQEQVEARPAV